MYFNRVVIIPHTSINSNCSVADDDVVICVTFSEA